MNYEFLRETGRGVLIVDFAIVLNTFIFEHDNRILPQLERFFKT